MIARTSRRTACVGLCATALLGGLAACGSSSSSTGGGDATPSGSATTTPVVMRDITVLLDWFPNPDQVSLYMAQSKGYFKDAGLNVKLQPPSDPSDVSNWSPPAPSS